MTSFKNIFYVLLVSALLTSTGCVSFFGGNDKEWNKPEKPELEEVEFKNITLTNGENVVYMELGDAKNLLKNINSLEAYIEKLELLINKMEKNR